MKKFKILALIFLSMLIITSCSANQNVANPSDKQYEGISNYYEEDMKVDYDVVKAKVIEIVSDDSKENRNIPIEADRRFQYLKIQLLNGNHKGEQYTVRNTIEMINPYKITFDLGENMYIYTFEDENGEIKDIHIYEKVRDKALFWLIIAFLAFILFIGKSKGIKTIITLAITIAIIILILLPLILKGFNPVVITVLLATIISAITIVIISGLNIKSLTAILGTISGVIISIICAYIMVNFAHLTGLGDEQATLLARIPQFRNLDYSGILLSGIIIGALGAVMDVALSIASAIKEIKENSPNISRKSLYSSGMNIGRDMMGSMSNTLILAYVGSSIQLLLLFISYNITFTEIVNMDMIASEIVMAVAGSIGLISAIPITTFIGCKLMK